MALKSYSTTASNSHINHGVLSCWRCNHTTAYLPNQGASVRCYQCGETLMNAGLVLPPASVERYVDRMEMIDRQWLDNLRRERLLVLLLTPCA